MLDLCVEFPVITHYPRENVPAFVRFFKVGLVSPNAEPLRQKLGRHKALLDLGLLLG